MHAITFAAARTIAPYHPKLNLTINFGFKMMLPRDRHRSETHFRTKSCHVSGWNHPNQVEEEDSQK